MLRRPPGAIVSDDGETEFLDNEQQWAEVPQKSACASIAENAEIEILDDLSCLNETSVVTDLKNILSPLYDNDEPDNFPVEALDDFAEKKEPQRTERKKTRNPTILTEEKRLAKQLKPKRALRRKTEEEKAMSPEVYKKYYYKMISEKYKQTCEVCGKRLPPERMEGHVNGHKGLQPYACEFCELQFNCKINMRKHVQRNHVVGVQIPCAMCDKVLISQMALRQHIRTVHEEKKYQCPICGLRSPNNHSLTRHMNIHTQTRNFVCPHCAKAFYCYSVLKIHLRTHSGEEPYKCVICPKGFVHRRLYVLHMKKLHPEEPLMRINGTKELKTTLMKKHY
ncbi:zinc finger protein 77-like isoform X2 [Toxorhynchites rutilus septentrionalis]|nr:zinc finger protein 77-like isoform X2 [Toxorhynchites rutilus septentrionalis]